MTHGAQGREILFHRLASNEYLHARRWYAQQGGEALAERFRKKYRWLRLERFPYLLYYSVLDDSHVLVLSVAHSSRRPGYWLRRLQG